MLAKPKVDRALDLTAPLLAQKSTQVPEAFTKRKKPTKPGVFTDPEVLTERHRKN